MDSIYSWQPDPAAAAATNVARMVARCGAADIDDLRRRSTADIGWWWGEVVADLGLPFRQPFTRVLDLSRGAPWAQWFIGGRLNVVDACISRWADDPAARDRAALVHRTEDGTTTTIAYGELAAQVAAAAAGLRRLGLGAGDAVAVLMPMAPEAVIAGYAVAAIGGLLVPLFSGFGPKAIAARLEDGDVKAVVTIDRTTRGGRQVDLEAVLDEALALVDGVAQVVVVRRGSAQATRRTTGRGRTDWVVLVADGATDLAGVTADTAAEAPLLLAYTSGTTGKPKGAVHTHAGFLTKVASELAYSFDVGTRDTFCWITDMGWIMGPLSMIGAHANGATLLLYEGVPTAPTTDTLWALVAGHAITVLGVSPTLTRTILGNAGDAHTRHDLSSVRIIGSSGEPWDPTSYTWLAREVLDGRAPIINFSGGTEVGGSFLAPYPVEPLRACSLGGPSLGMDVDVLDAAGRPVRGQLGELVCRQPWPSMTKSLWRDDARYLETYWSTFQGVWRHGDWATVDDDGQWFLFGRSDEVMNIAGKRVGPAEVESVLTAHPGVNEAAAVGVPDTTKGEAIWCFWVAAGDPGSTGGTTAPPDPTGAAVSKELADLVAAELGRPFRPGLVRRVPALPKTRSAKILRRAVRAAAMGADPGDLSGAENPEALDGIRAAVAEG